MHNKSLEIVKEEKYLGVVINQKLSWKPHIVKMTSKANNSRHFLQRNLVNCNKEVKLQCYKTYVRPILEYSSTVWDPVNNKGLNEKIEGAQNKSIRWICNKWDINSSPTSMAKELKLQSLHSRRQIAKLKLLHSFNHELKFLPNNIRPALARCTDTRFKVIYGRINIYADSFFPSTISKWNKLPPNIVNTTSPEAFATLLEKFIS